MLLFPEHGAYFIVGFALVAVTAPLLVELLVITLAAMMPRHERTPHTPVLSKLGRLIILVPSHNEEINVGQCVESISASAGGPGDILVIAHNCADRTTENARATGAMVSVLDNPNLAGKGNALAHGFRIAFQDLGADAVMVIDADSTVSVDLVTLVRKRLECVSVLQCRYECRSTSNNSKSRLRALAFFCMNVVRPMGRQRLHLSCGIFGNGFAIRREVIEQVPYDAHSIVEDLEFHLALVTAGIRCEFVEDARVWAEVPVGGKGAVTQSARWEGGRLRMLSRHGPSLFLKVLRGRVALLEPLLDLAGLPLAMEVASLFTLLLLPVPIFRIYALSGTAIVVIHLLFAIYSGPDPRADLRALVHAPFYVMSKIGMLPAVLLKARSRAAWIRTSRPEAPK